MTSEKLIQVFTFYRQELAGRGISPEQLEDYHSTGTELEADASLYHLAYMCDEAIVLVRDGRQEKAFRWLGFIQGVLFSEGIFTLDDLKNHSRPDMQL
jgi:hypothetical protein